MVTAGIPQSPATPFRRIHFIAALTRWNDARLTRNALRRLSRHELGDIGIVDAEALIRD
jgi:uncharacterized protein YjiS (DUF1127 family)